jgi:hypothetical protein
MTKWKIILGFVCGCCFVSTGHALNDRTQKLLESQSVNAQPSGAAPTNNGSPAGVNAHANYGSTHGVFDSPVTSKSGAAGNVPLRKP